MIRALIFALYAGCAFAQDSFAGRWALESVDSARRVYWLEVTSSAPVAGEFFGVTGGRLERLRDASIDGGRLRFRVERGPDAAAARKMEGSADLRLGGETLAGTITSGGREVPVRGWRSPVIADHDDGTWIEGASASWIDSHFSRWRAYPDREKEWQAGDGVLSNLSGKARLLVSRADLWNFRVKLEYRLPKGGNAGIGLRHHYELQLADDFGQPPDVHGNASLYSQIAPSVNASKPAGEWQAMEITLIGRDLTVVLNGKRVIDRARIRGLTGLALDPDETKPGPLSLQGDHGKVEYRNLTVSEMVKRPGKVLLESDLTRRKPADRRITVSGGAWNQGWEVTGDTDRILVDVGRDVTSGYLEVEVTRRGALDFPQGQHKRNWLALFASPDGHQSPGGYARAGGAPYGFSKAEIFSANQKDTICEKKFGLAQDWKLDGKTVHIVRAEVRRNRMTWRLGDDAQTHCGGDAQPVTHFRYAMLGGLLDRTLGWHHGSLVGLKVLRFRIVATE